MRPAEPDFPCAAEPYLPHAAPMALLDDITACGSEDIQCQVHIDSSTLFAGPDGVPNWVGVEYMAQAIAAWAGVQARRRGEPVKIGFLVSTRKMNCAVDAFPLCRSLNVFAQRVSISENGLATFDCRIELDQRELVSARINVFQPADPEAFLKGEAT